MSSDVPGPPAGLKTAGKQLWGSLLGGYEFEEHELALLREMCRTADALDELDCAVRRDGMLVDGHAHPAAVEARQQRIVLARLSASLRLPSGDEDEQPAGLRRPQRRGAARGAYRPRVVS